MASYSTAISNLQTSLGTLAELNRQLDAVNRDLAADQGANLAAAQAAATITGSHLNETVVQARILQDSGRAGSLTTAITAAVAAVKADMTTLAAAMP